MSVATNLAGVKVEIGFGVNAVGGDYFVLVKDNQPTLHKEAQQAFVIPRSFSPLQEALGV